MSRTGTATDIEVPVAATPARRTRPRLILIFGFLTLSVGVAVRVGLACWPTFATWLESQRLLFVLRSENPTEADEAARKLIELGPTGELILMGAIDDRTATARALVCQYLPMVHQSREKIVATLSDALGDPEPSVRLAAARAFGPPHNLATWADQDAALRESAISSLTALLSDEDTPIRIKAADGLGAFGPNASSAVETLDSLLRDGNPNLRASAGCALIRIDGPKHPEAGNAIIDSLTKPDPETLTLDPITLAAALHLSGPDVQARALTTLVAQLRSEKPEVRSFTLGVFQEMKEDARSAVPTLESLVSELASRAGKSIIETTGPSGVATVEDVNLEIRSDVASALVAIDGKLSFVGVGALLDAVAEPTVCSDRRWRAYSILQRVDLNALRLTVPVLLEMIDDPNPIVRDDTREFVKRIDPKALFDALKKSSRP